MRMRIYEYAKQHGLSSKDVIDVLEKNNILVNSHMAVLSAQGLTVLDKHFSSDKTTRSETTMTNGPKEKIALNDAEKKEPQVVSQDSKEVLLSESKSKEMTINTEKTTPSSTTSKKTPMQSTEQSAQESKVVAKSATAQVPGKQETTAVVEPLVLEPMTVAQLAEKLKKQVSDIIVQLLRWGMVVSKNQVVKQDVIVKLAELYEIPVVKPQATTQQPTTQLIARQAHTNQTLTEERRPVVVVVGHVDHGKTTLLDFIRKARVAAKEKGGITQHIGAYEAVTPQGAIVFIDTPGHEAFVKIRQRGIKVADIAILVVAADDGVMPQTVEAIRQAKAMGLTIIVAMNKIDKVDIARLDVIKRQLSQYDVLAEEWGGDVICVPISAKNGTGIDQLLEMVILQAQMLELKTNTHVPASCYVLESKIERGRGAVATLICHVGTLRIGDHFICGKTSGRVTSIVDSYGRNHTEVLPTVPVQVAGFDQLPEVGDLFKVVPSADIKAAKNLQNEQRVISFKPTVQPGSIALIVKTDNDSSKEALIDALYTINKKLKKQFSVVYSAVGEVNESDVDLAYNTGSTIITLHTRIDNKALSLAAERKVSIHSFDIIYKLTEYLQEWGLAESAEQVTVRKKIGYAEVLRVFDIKGVGVIAGSIVRDGRFTKDGFIVIMRNGRKVGEGPIKSLQREKKSVKEAHTGFECGFVVGDFTDWIVGDIAECYALHTELRQPTQ